MGAELNGLSNLQDRIDDLDDKWGQSGEIVYRVVTDKGYAVVVEFGRGPVEAQEAEALRFTVDGETVFAKSVGPAPPQPFMRPAVRAAERNLTTLADGADSVDEFLERVAFYVAREAKDRVTRDAGELARSIEVEKVR